MDPAKIAERITKPLASLLSLRNKQAAQRASLEAKLRDLDAKIETTNKAIANVRAAIGEASDGGELDAAGITAGRDG